MPLKTTSCFNAGAIQKKKLFYDSFVPVSVRHGIFNLSVERKATQPLKNKLIDKLFPEVAG
jgi:hypothetical protein